MRRARTGICQAISLQDLGNLGEFIGAVGVIITLIYLAVQIRQNTRSVRASTYQVFTDSFRQFRTMLVSDSRLGLLWTKGLNAPAELSETELGQFDALMMIFFRGVETSFYHAGEGFLDEGSYQGWLDEAVSIGRRPGARGWWGERSGLFNPGFRSFWDERMSAEVSGGNADVGS